MLFARGLMQWKNSRLSDVQRHLSPSGVTRVQIAASRRQMSLRHADCHRDIFMGKKQRFPRNRMGFKWLGEFARDLTNLYADLRREMSEETMCFFVQTDLLFICRTGLLLFYKSSARTYYSGWD